MGLLALSKVELIKGNVKMLDWAMAVAASNKKNIATPKITISDYIPYMSSSLLKSMLSKDP